MAKTVRQPLFHARVWVCMVSYGEKTLPSVKAFGNWDLSLAKCRDFDRDSGSEDAVSAGPSPVNQSVTCTGAMLGRLSAMVERARGIGGQAAFR